jgi:hypothetical protein
MAVFNGAFPIISGQEQASRDFAAACMGGAARSSRRTSLDMGSLGRRGLYRRPRWEASY